MLDRDLISSDNVDWLIFSHWYTILCIAGLLRSFSSQLFPNLSIQH